MYGINPVLIFIEAKANLEHEYTEYSSSNAENYGVIFNAVMTAMLHLVRLKRNFTIRPSNKRISKMIVAEIVEEFFDKVGTKYILLKATFVKWR